MEAKASVARAERMRAGGRKRARGPWGARRGAGASAHRSSEETEWRATGQALLWQVPPLLPCGKGCGVGRADNDLQAQHRGLPLPLT